MKSLKRFLYIPDSGQTPPSEPFGRRRQRAHHTPKPSAQRDHDRFQSKPPQDPYENDGDVPIAHRASPQRTEDKEVEDHQIGQDDKKMKPSELEKSMQPGKPLKKINRLSGFDVSSISIQQKNTQHHPERQ